MTRASIGERDLHRTAMEILRLGSRELHLVAHHREVCGLLAGALGAELVELWQSQGRRLLRARLEGRRERGRVGRPAAPAFSFAVELDPAATVAREPGPAELCRLLLRNGRRLALPRARQALRGSGYRLVSSSPPGCWRLAAEPGTGQSAPAVLTLIPFTIEASSDRGLLLLGCSLPRAGLAAELGAQPLGPALGLGLAGQRAQAKLRERVKELTCLYGFSQLLRQADAPLERVLAQAAELLPPALQYPELASGCVVLDGRAFHGSHGPHEGTHALRADLQVKGRRRGFIEVRYREPLPILQRNPFLPEERTLLQVLARQLGLFLERRQADEERTNLQAQLRHSDRLATIGALSAGVAHELNEPLGAILGFAQLAQKSPGLPVGLEDDLSKIVAAALQARAILKKLMLFARQSPPRMGPQSLNRLVEEGLTFLAARCSREGVTLIKKLQPNLPSIVADGSQIEQVVVNLAVNAIQAMPGGGRLTVRTERRRRKVALVVEDTGTGMPPEVLERAFLPFFTTKEVGKGTGLGLAVVHGIVKAHNGRVEVESQPGRGTRFEVLLPIREAATERAHA